MYTSYAYYNSFFVQLSNSNFKSWWLIILEIIHYLVAHLRCRQLENTSSLQWPIFCLISNRSLAFHCNSHENHEWWSSMSNQNQADWWWFQIIITRDIYWLPYHYVFVMSLRCARTARWQNYKKLLLWLLLWLFLWVLFLFAELGIILCAAKTLE